MALLSPINGLRIVTDVNLTELGDPVPVRRTWRERLWSRPWRPWQAIRWVRPTIPSRRIFHFGNQIVVHPAMLDEMRALLDPPSGVVEE